MHAAFPVFIGVTGLRLQAPCQVSISPIITPSLCAPCPPPSSLAPTVTGSQSKCRACERKMIIVNLSWLVQKKATNLMFLDPFLRHTLLKTSILFKPYISIRSLSHGRSTHLSVSQHICFLSKPLSLCPTGLSTLSHPLNGYVILCMLIKAKQLKQFL